MKKLQLTDLLTSIAIAELVGVLSSLLAGNSRAFYETLPLPPLSPPGWVFPVVWTLLYALMGAAAYLIYRADADAGQKRSALTLYVAQLAVNFLWSIVFFRFQLFWLSVAVLLLLNVLVALTILFFRRISRPAAYLLLPYLAWILFAAYLNIGVAVLQ